MASLRVRTGPLSGRTIEIDGDLVIGRENADLVIEDPELSRRHAVVRRLERGLEVEDLGSSNGTFVDGVRIEVPTVVGGGSELKLGTTLLVVEGVLQTQPTRMRQVADPQKTKVADPQATVARSVPADLQTTVARSVPTDGGTEVTGSPADLQVTAARAIPAEARQAAPASPPPAPPAASAVPLATPTAPLAVPSTPIGTFSPPGRKRNRGLASRSWVPVALSFGTVILVAIALVIYFASQ
jgi:pSer/pThr/pTyr-binding forkhead associated (FHA) protein